MRVNRKVLEALVFFCLLVAGTTMRSGPGVRAHAVEAVVALLILVSVFAFVRARQRTRGSH